MPNADKVDEAPVNHVGAPYWNIVWSLSCSTFHADSSKCIGKVADETVSAWSPATHVLDRMEFLPFGFGLA